MGSCFSKSKDSNKSSSGQGAKAAHNSSNNRTPVYKFNDPFKGEGKSLKPKTANTAQTGSDLEIPKARKESSTSPFSSVRALDKDVKNNDDNDPRTAAARAAEVIS